MALRELKTIRTSAISIGDMTATFPDEQTPDGQVTLDFGDSSEFYWHIEELMEAKILIEAAIQTLNKLRENAPKAKKA